MAMTPRLRTLALTAHVASSIGWFGAVAAFLVLAVAGLTRESPNVVLACYVAMSLTTWFAVVPLAIISLISGAISSLGTKWGLVRHYWVMVKLVVSIFITALLALHMPLVDFLASASTKNPAIAIGLHGLRIQMIFYGAAAMLVLLLLTALSMYKPSGMTRYGWRKLQEERASSRV
jgi:hypothetical protein